MNTFLASMNKISFFFSVFGFCLSKNQRVAGSVTDENILEGRVTICEMIPSLIIFFLISYSEPDASDAELAITSAALPFLFKAVAK